ncbi:MAG: hypothetical protein DRZ76_01770 [Candidatus Nealsonbacteria bacterium]|nr:MAG: hypothetical protein DRZ76_01770 [Candidatus Nealsonbacteria bacterium]
MKSEIKYPVCNRAGLIFEPWDQDDVVGVCCHRSQKSQKSQKVSEEPKKEAFANIANIANRAQKVKRTSDDEGLKFQEGKPEWSVLPFDALKQVVRVFEYGANKYGRPYTYRAGITYSKLFSAMLRHATDWWRGVDVDQDSGCHPLAHVCANALMLLVMLHKKQYDNRDRDTIKNNFKKEIKHD